MKWSLKVGSYVGVGVYIHWTFMLLIAWIFMMHLGAGQTAAEAFSGVGFVLALFACVLLHEFGHVLMAMRYGVKTRDITLLPIGGVARLERIPEKPIQEFWVALAGPLVNVAIAAVIFLLLLLDGSFHLPTARWFEGGFLSRLMWINLLLVCFNLLPAFPMDGGRVLRSLLAIWIGRRRATILAASIGQSMAVFFGIVGLLYNPFLIIIGIFVFLGAQGEATHVEVESALGGLRVRDAMMTRFRTLPSQASLGFAVNELLAGSQQDFPVLEDGKLSGVLRMKDLVNALADGRGKSLVGDVMSREDMTVNETDNLMRTLESMSLEKRITVPVMADGSLSGLLTLENISELILVNSALAGKNMDPATRLRRQLSTS